MGLVIQTDVQYDTIVNKEIKTLTIKAGEGTAQVKVLRLFKGDSGEAVLVLDHEDMPGKIRQAIFNGLILSACSVTNNTVINLGMPVDEDSLRHQHEYTEGKGKVCPGCDNTVQGKAYWAGKHGGYCKECALTIAREKLKTATGDEKQRIQEFLTCTEEQGEQVITVEDVEITNLHTKHNP